MGGPIHNPRRPVLTTHYNWCSRYQGLNSRIAYYEERMLALIDANGADPQEAQHKRAYTRALHAWKKALHSLTQHMSNPV